MPLPKLSEHVLREHSSSSSFERGMDDFQRGAVTSLTARGQTLSAEVEGSEYHPYQITVAFDNAGVTDASCSCPYDWVDWCKHIVAALLAYLNEPDLVEEKADLETLIGELSKEQLISALKRVSEKHPEVIEMLELYLMQPQATPNTLRKRQTPIDTSLFERLTRAAIREAELDWDGNVEYGELYETIDKVAPFLEQGDTENALVILQTITEAFFDEVEDMDYEGYYYDEWLYQKLDIYWAETVLSAELDDKTRQALHDQVTAWNDTLEHYHMSSFVMTDAALAQGWDYPPLVATLQGKISEAGAWESPEVVPEFADDLARIRLRILERQGRHQEYLYLAQAEDLTKEYLNMLVKLGRTEEALEQAKSTLTRPSDALSLSKTLREQGELSHALDVAEYGLRLSEASNNGMPSLDAEVYRLASWASELATGLEEWERAQSAAILAFKAMPSFTDYQHLQELVGTGWPQLKEELLTALRQTRGVGDAKVDIFLSEGLVDDAIAAVEDHSVYGDSQIQRVMDAALEHHPEWVVDHAKRRAEGIMGAGKAKYYHEAAS